MPDAWVAARCGWNQLRVQPGPREDEEVSWLGEDDRAAAEDAEEETPERRRATELAAAFDSDEDDGLGSSTDRRRESAPKAKSGGKGHSDKARPDSQRRVRWTCLRCFLRTKKVLARKAG